jgi:hypothetical protein
MMESSSPRFLVKHSPLSTHFLSTKNQEAQDELANTTRDKLRQATGFSLTAVRAAFRAATGISLSAMYASAVLVSSIWVRKTSAAILSIFPAWLRYFIQPFLVLYYVPLFIIRGLSGPTRARARKRHETIIDGWKSAIDFADKAGKDGYKPVQWNKDGYFELVKPPKPNQAEDQDELANAIAKSVDQAMENGYGDD